MPEVQMLAGWRIAGGRIGRLEDCSAIIPTYNRLEMVIRLLEAIAGLPDQPGEVVVVDGHPSGALSEQLRRWAEGKPLRFDLVYAHSKPGLTRQRNAGIDTSSGDFLFYFDDDTVPKPGYFAHIRRVFAEDTARRIGVVGACIVNEMDHPIAGRWKLRLALGLVDRNIPPMRYYRTCTSLPRGLMKPFTGTIDVDIVAGGASAWRREVFRTERFSEYFEGYSQGEDVEMSLRAARRWKLVCCGDAHILHLHAAGGRPLHFARGRMDVVNKYFIWKRHTPDAEPEYVRKFWLDIAFQVAMEGVTWLRRPWSLAPAARAGGLAFGAVECLVRPPRYEEPPAARRYVLGCPQGKAGIVS